MRQHVQGIVFWTKNLGPFLTRLPEVRERGFPFVVQYSISAYPRTLVETTAGLIAVGGGESMAGTAWISTDGLSWDLFGEPLDGSYFNSAVVHDGTLFVGGATQAGTLETGVESHAAIWSTPLTE